MHLAVVLHTHLPYVRHPEHARSLEESWMHEAIWGSYLRLIDVIRSAPHVGQTFLTISLSPTLLEMFADPLLRTRFVAETRRLRDLATRLLEKTEWRRFEKALLLHKALLGRALETYEAIGRDLTRAFVSLAESGRVELITTAATHAHLPTLKNGASVRAQIRLGLRTFENHTSRISSGFWLPECAFSPALDTDLAESGTQYTVLDAHGLRLAEPNPPFDVYAPIISDNGVVYFAREPEAAIAIWSRQKGYPRNGDYREFHRDVGREADAETLGEWMGPNDTRRTTGLKLYGIDGEPYEPERAKQRACADARHFAKDIEARLRDVKSRGVEDPIIVAPFDTELFGHWWFEGPEFLSELLANLVESTVSATSLPSFIASDPSLAIATPATSSWGEGGYHEVWTSPASARYLRHVHRAEITTLEVDAVVRDTLATEKRRRARLQTIRELLLLQASDWPFMLHTGSATEYGSMRARLHRWRLERLARMAMTEEWTDEDMAFLTEVELNTPFLSSLDEDAFANVFDPW